MEAKRRVPGGKLGIKDDSEGGPPGDRTYKDTPGKKLPRGNTGQTSMTASKRHGIVNTDKELTRHRLLGQIEDPGRTRDTGSPLRPSPHHRHTRVRDHAGAHAAIPAFPGLSQLSGIPRKNEGRLCATIAHHHASGSLLVRTGLSSGFASMEKQAFHLKDR